MRSNYFRIIFFLIFIIGMVVRGVDVWRPIDWTAYDYWREPEVGGIARNFYREGMNILYPRTDWRGEGPGYVESEFPLYPWVIAILYKAFGYHEEVGRVVSFVLSLATCILFFGLAGRLLPRRGAVTASILFVLVPLGVRVSTSIKTEPLMLFCYLASVYYFIKWCDTSRRTHFALSFVGTTLGILAKATAAHVGILLAAISIDRFGLKALRKKELWFFAVCSLSLSFFWYAHARGLYLVYGNSLGISNEAFVRMGMSNFLMAAKYILVGIANIEIEWVWMPTGVLLGCFGIMGSFKDRSFRIILYWLGALAVFYIVTGRTSGEMWASYYHVFSIPAACLLMGRAMTLIDFDKLEIKGWKDLVKLGSCAGGVGALMITGYWGLRQVMLQYFPPLSTKVEFRLILVFGCSAVILLCGLGWLLGKRAIFGDKLAGYQVRRLLSSVIAVLFISTVFLEAQILKSGFLRRRPDVKPLYICAKQFSTDVPSGTLIVASGGPEKDQYGLQCAYNAPYMFFWMDRKGFSMGESEQSIEKLKEFRRRGAQYFVAEKERLALKPRFEADLRKEFELLQECESAMLFKLNSSPDQPTKQ